jgi:2-amino-4-hydroxy-6-hydroxymethyldihydropteridine diphosphokinase
VTDNSHLVYLSLGSNIDRSRNISTCLDSLAAEYGQLQVSSVYESESVGFKGDPFYNLVVGLRTNDEIDVLISKLHQIEADHGRERGGPRFSGRSLDIDILLFDSLKGIFHGIQLPRAEITENAYVLWPLSEVAGQMCLPGNSINLYELWARYDKEKQKLWRIEFPWREVNLPLRTRL